MHVNSTKVGLLCRTVTVCWEGIKWLLQTSRPSEVTEKWCSIVSAYQIFESS